MFPVMFGVNTFPSDRKLTASRPVAAVIPGRAYGTILSVVGIGMLS